MKTLFSFAAYMTLLTSCLSQSSCPEYDSIRAYAKNNSKNEGWKLASIGAFGDYGYSGPGFDMVYRGRFLQEISEARDLMIRHILNFLEQNKNNKNLIETVDLKNRQFSYRNIQLSISLYSDHYDRYDKSIALICFNDNAIRYWRYDKAKKDSILVHKESINEALQLSQECKDKSIIHDDLAFPYQGSIASKSEGN